MNFVDRFYFCGGQGGTVHDDHDVFTQCEFSCSFFFFFLNKISGEGGTVHDDHDVFTHGRSESLAQFRYMCFFRAQSFSAQKQGFHNISEGRSTQNDRFGTIGLDLEPAGRQVPNGFWKERGVKLQFWSRANQFWNPKASGFQIFFVGRSTQNDRFGTVGLDLEPAGGRVPNRFWREAWGKTDIWNPPPV